MNADRGGFLSASKASRGWEVNERVNASLLFNPLSITVDHVDLSEPETLVSCPPSTMRIHSQYAIAMPEDGPHVIAAIAATLLALLAYFILREVCAVV